MVLLHLALQFNLGRFWLAFDCTYLTKSLAQLTLHNRTALVGGTWEPGLENLAFVDLDQNGLDLKTIPRAPQVIEFLAWNPSLAKKMCLPICSMPVPNSYGGTHSEKKSQWSVLETLGRVLQSSGQLVRGVVFDCHTSHSLVRRLMHGLLDDVNLDEVRQVPWFSSLKWQPLPQTILPRLPIQLVFNGEEIVYGLPGPCELLALDADDWFLYPSIHTVSIYTYIYCIWFYIVLCYIYNI